MKLIPSARLLALLLLSVPNLHLLHAASGQMTTLSIATGQSQGLALRSDGSVWTWGTNIYGEMGVSNLTSSTFPVRIPGVSGVVGISAGPQHSLAVITNGTVWAWGSNIGGQLGNGSNYAASVVPVKVSRITNAVAVAGGGNHSLALLANGQVMAWGTNSSAQLGNGTGNSTNLPVFVSNLTNVVKVAAGLFYSAALDATGVVWCWGDGTYGEIGNAQNTYSLTPVAVLSNVVDIAAGGAHNIALKSDGTVWAWGYNGDGELGLGNTSSVNVPTQVTNLVGVQCIGAGLYMSSATLTNGQNLIWGFQNGSVMLPTQIAMSPPFVKFALGVTINWENFSFGLGNDGSVWAWGVNTYGQFGNGNLVFPRDNHMERIPTECFAPNPIARWGEFLRGNVYDFSNTNHDLDFCSIVVPIDMEQGVALNPTGSDAYCYSNSPPWFLSITNQALIVANSLASGTNLNVITVNNPVTAFGTQGGGSPLYLNQPYRIGVYAGGFDEGTPAATNVIRISVYTASSFTAGASNVTPYNVFYIPLPRRTVNTDSNFWDTFMANGAAVTVTTNGLTTTVQFLDSGDTTDEPFGISWLNGQTMTNYILTAYQLTHTAANTNYFYRVEVLGKVQVGNNVLAPMATNSAGVWTATPLYSLDFSQLSPLHSIYVDRLFFQGTPMPPTYADTPVVGPAGLNLMVTNQYALTNNSAYASLDASPELRRHPLLDQFVLDMNKDPLALVSYVINKIELVDPYTFANGAVTVQPQITCGGIDRSALGTFLEGQGSPVEQCALLVYLLRQAGYSAAYVFPTNNNIYLSASHASQLLEVQVNGIVNQIGIPYITNSLLSLNYPWVVANIGTNTVHIFPWIKDHSIQEGVNLYDYLPVNYSTALQWIEQYVRGNTNILNLDPENVVSKLFPAFVQQYLSPLGPSYSLDSLGVRMYNRQHQFPTWSFLPQPDAVTNLNNLAVVDSLGNSNSFSFLANTFNTVQVKVYSNSVSGSPLLDSGNWYSCDFHDRKLLLFTNAGRLSLWLAPYRPNVTTIQAFAGPSSTALQSNSVPVGSLNSLAIQTIHHRQAASLSNLYSFFPVKDSLGVTNLAHCNLGDVAAIALDFGHVSASMMQQHEEAYWGLQRQRATNSTFVPSVWDYQGTAAYLLGMGYYQKKDAFDFLNQQWHKIHTLLSFSSGLGVIGATGNSTNMQAKVDMGVKFELWLGNSSLHQESGVPDFTALHNYYDLHITAGSAQEHDILQTMFPDQNAVSTVRLLQMAQQRATNGNASILELFNNNYAAAGNQTNAGYGTNLLMNQDSGIWSSVSNIFTLIGGNYARVLITPGMMTNSTQTYIGMGALMLGETLQTAAISGNGAVLNGGWGSQQPGFNTTPPAQNTLSWNLNVDSTGNPTFTYNNPTAGSTFLSTLSPQDAAGINSGSTSIGWTPQQTAQGSQQTALTGQSGGSTATGISGAANSGGFGLTDAGLRSLAQTYGEPVNVTSGEYYVDTVDLSLPGPLPLQLRRNYTSLNLQANGFGYGWKMNFNPYLMVASNIIYGAELDGTTLAYHQQTNGVWKVLVQDNPTLNNNSTYGIGSTANLFNSVLTTNSGTNYVITAPDGSIRTYQMMSFPISSGSNVLSRTRPYLAQWQDNAGNFASFYYGTNPVADDWGQLNRINMANGNTLVFKYDFYGRITQAMTGDGRFVNYLYDSYGDLTTVTLPDQSQCQYQYQHYSFTTNSVTITDSTHLITQEIKPSGRILANVYDNLRRVTSQSATVGTTLALVTNCWFYYTNNITSLTNQLASGTTRVEDFFHHPTLYYYTNNLITNIVDALGGTNLMVWYPDTATNLTGWYPRSLQYTVDKRGLTNQFFYDSFGNVTQTVVIGNITGEGFANQTATNTASYTTNNLPYIVRDPAGNGTQYNYDSADPYRPLQTVVLAGTTPVVTNYFFYTNVAQVSALGTTNRAFGLCWRTANGGATNDLVFNGNGFPVQTIQYAATTDNPTDTDPAVVHNFSYNLRGQKYQDQVVGGGLTQFDFDPMGRTLSRLIFDQSSNTLSQEFYYYNQNGDLEWYDGPRSGPEDYQYYIYDGDGRAIQNIKFRSQAKTDGSGVEAPAGNALYATTFQTFDGVGNKTSITDPRGAVTTNQFDALNRLTQQQVWDLNGAVLSTNQFAYEKGGLVTLATNGLGGVTQTLYTTAGKPYYVSNPNGSTNGFTYYLDGRINREIQGNGAYWRTFYNDAALTATRIFYSAGGIALATNITLYDARHNALQTTDAGGNTFTNVFDGLNRVKAAIGPAVVTVTASGGGLSLGGPTTYTTTSLQHSVTNVFDAAGLATSSYNALGEKTTTTFDALGRTTSTRIYSALGTLVREKYYSYSADHNSVTVTDGSGASAISQTTYTDNDGHAVLSVSYPSAGMTEFTVNQYDLAGNLVGSQHKSTANGSGTTWTTASFAYDGLNRVIQQVDRDGAATAFGYDALNDLTNRIMPGTNLVWSATYNNAGQKLTEKDTAGGQSARNNAYTYFAAGTAWAGLMNTFTDGRGVVLTNLYDDWLRVTNVTTTGSLAEQQMSVNWQYDPRGLVTGISQAYASTNTGPATTISRTFDAYGQMASENGLGQGWDSAGRRTQVGSIGFAYQADGQMTVVNSSSFSYSTGGLLTSKVNGARTVSIDQRDGEGRPLQATTRLNLGQVLKENWAWTGDGLPANYIVQGDYTNTRNLSYTALSRRLASETLNLSGSTAITNNYIFDKGAPGGPGVLTQAGQGGLAWSGATDSFSRIQNETNAVIHRTARGHFNGAASLRGYLNSQPIDVRFDAHNAGIWNADMALKQGTNVLSVYADHPGGFFTTNRQSTFNVSTGGPDQETSSYDGAGNVTNRVWKNGNGQVIKTQTLTWDAFGRLVKVNERDSNTNGYNLVAVFDGLGRQVQTTETAVTNSLLLVSNPAPVVVSFTYDPQVEFQPICITINQGASSRQDWLAYGPDISGRYGGMQGVGGLETITTTTPGANGTAIVVNDSFGNVLGAITNGSIVWNPSRLNLYAPVEGYMPPRLSLSQPTYASLAWRTRPVSVAGFVQLGARTYDLQRRAFLSADPLGHPSDPSLNTAFNGNPGLYFDADGRCVAGMANDVYGIGQRTVNGVIQAGAIGSDMVGQSAASLFGYGAYYQGYSQLYQNIYANSSSGPTASGILTGTLEAEANVATLGLYGMGKGLGVAAATGDYTQAQDAALGSLLMSGSTRIMQGQGVNPWSVGQGSGTVNLGGEGEVPGANVVNVQPAAIHGSTDIAAQTAQDVAQRTGQQVVMAPGNNLPFSSGSIRNVVANSVPIDTPAQTMFGPSFTSAEIMRIVAPGGSLSGSSMPAALIQAQNMRNAIITVNTIPSLLFTAGQTGRQ